MPRHTSARYDSFARALHWLMAGLIVLAWTVIELKGLFPRGSSNRALVTSLHVQLGLAVAAFLAVRIPWRLAHPVAPAPTRAPAWTERIAAATKLGFYLLMLLMPVLGIATAQARGDAVAFLGFALPDLFGWLADQKRALKELHEVLGNALIALAGVHGGAALWHHFVLRDATLERMLGPSRG